MTESNSVWFGLIGAIVGAVPALIGAVGPWLRDRDRIATEKRELELAKLEVEFVSAWIDASSKLSGDAAQVQALARARLFRLLDGRPGLVPTSPAGTPPASRAKGRTAFLIYLGFFAFMIFGSSIDASNNVSWSHLLQELQSGDGLVTLLVFAIPLVVLAYRWRRAVSAVRRVAAGA